MLMMAAVPPMWRVLPFGLYLVLIAGAPLAFGRFWQKNRNKFILALLLSAPVVVYLLGSHGGHLLIDSLKEYVAFVTLLAALFIISGGIYLRGSLAGTPLANTSVLAVGAALASFIG